MPDISKKEGNGPEVWKLALPDWAELDSVWRSPLPFALWSVGEQPLLYHWLDAAVDQETARVIPYVADRPDEVRKAMEAAKLWPIEWEIKSVPRIDPNQCDEIVNRLPRAEHIPGALPQTGWELIKYWRQLERDWLVRFTKETESLGMMAAIGKHCEIDPSAKLVQPFWIGDFVSIGPGCTVGPDVVIEDGSVLAGGNQLSDAHVGKHTYLGPETDLSSALMFRNQLINLRYEARVDNLESFFADNVGGPADQRSLAQKTDWKERIYAMWLLLRWWRFREKPVGVISGIDGHEWPMPAGPNPKDRAVWLQEVLQGKMKLFGVTPRTEADLATLPKEWQDILRDAPVGAFSYADVVGIHQVGTEEEAMHCIYQVKGDTERCAALMHLWVQQNMSNQPLEEL